MAAAEGGRAFPGRLLLVREVDPALVGMGVAVGLVLATRLPLATHYLLNWDAAQFALGLRHFDVPHHEPHPPGYIGYEALGRLLMLALGDANRALVALSVLGECAGVALAFLFARRLFGTFSAWVTALALALSPLYWYYGEAANTYALEPLLTLAVAWPCWRLWHREPAAAYWSAAALAAAGALRPSTMVLLAPLYLVGVWRLRDRGTGLRSLALGAGAVALWAVPLVVLSGGPYRYLRASLQLGSTVTVGTAIWAQGLNGLLTTANAVSIGLGLELGLFAVALAGAFVAVPLFFWRRTPMPPLWWAFCLVWTLPGLLTFLLVHIGQVVYVQVFVMALFLSLGPAVLALARTLHRPAWAPAMVALGLLFNTVSYFVPGRSSLAGQLALHDRQAAALVAAVRPQDPARTVLLTDASGGGSNYREAQYYLPAFHRLAIGQDNQGRLGVIYGDVYDLTGFRHARRLRIAARVDEFVLIDAALVSAYVADPERLHRLQVAPGERIYIWRGPIPRIELGELWFGGPYRERRGVA